MRKNLISSKYFALIIVIMSVSGVYMSAVGQTPDPAPQIISDGQKAHIKGVIIKRDGDIATVRTQESDVVDVLLGNDTRVETATWWWSKKRSSTLLIPGMRVEAWGTGNSRSQLAARKITLDKTDMKMAEAVSGGVAPLQAEQAQLLERQKQLENRQALLEDKQQKLAGQQDELQNSHSQLRGEQNQLKTDLQRTKEETAMLGKRMSQLDEYETTHSAKVNFATGKATLTAEGKAALDEIAEKALATEGYLIEVAGFTDSVGSEMLNHELSRRRAEVVIDYLTAAKQVPIRRLLTPIGFGESQPIADNGTNSGRAENRRAEVKILVNRAMAKNQ